MRVAILKRFERAAVLSATMACAFLAGCASSNRDSAVVAQATQFNTSLAPAEMKHPDLDRYLQAVGARIITAAQRADAAHIGPKTHFDGPTQWMFEDVHFYLVNSKTLNAFTTGGHSVYIYNELFQLCQNEEQLAAVMSHEFAHIYCRHVQKGMNNQLALQGVVMAATGAGYLAGGEASGAQYAQTGANAGKSLGGFIVTGFTRKDEAEADHYGQIFYTFAGWDPAHFGDFFGVMKAKVGDVASDMTSDHPSLASRVTEGAKQAPGLEGKRPSPLPEPVAAGAQFGVFQRLAVQVSATTPNDTQVLNTKKLLDALPRSCWIPVPQPDQEDARQELLKTIKPPDPKPTQGN